MNKVQIIKNKEQKQLRAFLISIFSFLVLIIGCDNPLVSDNQPIIPEGKGSFSLRISDEARTILPSTPSLNDFVVYNLSFIPISGGAER